jgi:hypothetical protein
LLNRKRRRKAVALVLFFEIKFLRLDWLTPLENGVLVEWIPTFPAAWRALADVGADLFPGELVRRLTEVSITIDRMRTGRLSLNPQGVDDLRSMAARCERDLGRYATEPFDGATEKWLTQYEATHGGKP